MEKENKFECGDVVSFDWINYASGEAVQTATCVMGHYSDCYVIGCPKISEDILYGCIDNLYACIDINEMLKNVNWHSDFRTATLDEFIKIYKEICKLSEYTVAIGYKKIFSFSINPQFGCSGYDESCNNIKKQIDDAYKEYEELVFSEYDKWLKEQEEVANKHSNLMNSLTPRQKAFWEYLTELHQLFVSNGNVVGITKVQKKHRISGITTSDFYNCGLSEDINIDYNSDKWIQYCCHLYEQVINKDLHIYNKWGDEIPSAVSNKDQQCPELF